MDTFYILIHCIALFSVTARIHFSNLSQLFEMLAYFYLQTTFKSLMFQVSIKFLIGLKVNRLKHLYIIKKKISLSFFSWMFQVVILMKSSTIFNQSICTKENILAFKIIQQWFFQSCDMPQYCWKENTPKSWYFHPCTLLWELFFFIINIFRLSPWV